MNKRKRSYAAGAFLTLSAISLIVALVYGLLTPTQGLGPDSPATIRGNTPVSAEQRR